MSRVPWLRRRDRELRIWNLVKGRVTYHSRLASEASAVAFTTDGTSYALVCGRDASLHSTGGSGVHQLSCHIFIRLEL